MKQPEQLTSESQDIAELLDASTLSNEFSWPQLKMLSGYFSLWQAAKGTTIFEQGSTDQTMAILISGQVDISHLEADQSLEHIATLNPPQTIGEMALIDGEPRSARVSARGNTTYLIIDRAGYTKLCHEHPALALKLVTRVAKTLSQRLRRMNSHSKEMG